MRKSRLQGAKSYLPYDVIGVVLLFAGPVALVSLASTGDRGALGKSLANALRYFAGIGAYPLSFLLIALGVLLLIGPLKLVSRTAALGALILFIVVITWRHVQVTPAKLDAAAYFASATLRAGGGILGACFACALRYVLGTACSYIVLIAAAIISVVLITDVPLSHMVRGLVRMFAGLIGVIAGREAHPRRRVAGGQAPLGHPGLPFGSDRSESVVCERNGRRDIPIVTGPSRDKAGGNGEKTGNNGQSGSKQPEDMGDFRLPPITLLNEPAPPPKRIEEELRGNIEIIERTLEEFKVFANVVEIAHGPTVTRYEIQLAPGIKVNKIVSLADNLAMSLAAIDVRVEAPIPGKTAIGVEVPNKRPAVVGLREALDTPDFWESPSKLSFALGKDVAGQPRFADLAKMPHLLIAGATNAGKSVCLNTLIASLLFRATPQELKFVLIDPKRVELSLFEGIPHLAYPVIKDIRQAAGILRAITKEMETRYERFAQIGTRNIDGYNERMADGERMYYLVIVVDELADLMMQAGAEVETSICRLAQLARATGIHLVIATQRPSVDIVTGTIKANISSRISFAVSSQVDSRTILDMNGAERLVGRGDMLFMPIDASKPTRIQGPYISEQEIEKLVTYLKEQRKPSYCLEPAQVGVAGGGEEDGSSDELYEPALRLIVLKGHASTSMLQRRFKIGYTRAARLVDAMEQQGVVGPLDGAKPREVLIGRDDLDRMLGGPSGLPYDGDGDEEEFEDD